MILPLKLGWEPFYSLPDGVEAAVGDRVRVVFAGRQYLGVVSGTDVVPDRAALAKIRDVREVIAETHRIFPTEITFWRQLALYYMCTVGEVFKAAYPTVKDKEVNARKREDVFIPCTGDFSLSGKSRSAFESVIKAFSAGKVAGKGSTVLLKSVSYEDILLSLCLRQSGNVVWLVPEIKLGKAMEDRLRKVLGSRLVVWGSNLTPAAKRRVTGRVREGGGPYVLLATRSGLFLPHRNLSLVIVTDEHDASYKQTSPSPRYNGRDASLILASIFKADSVLCSPVPSLESRNNCLCGKYSLVEAMPDSDFSYEIIDTRSEARKRGMDGDISRKLASAVDASSSPVVFYKPRRAAFPALEELESQIEHLAGISLTDDLVENPAPEGTGLLAVFGVDAMLGKQDFRADERALQIIQLAAFRIGEKRGLHTIIQTREASHPVFRVLSSGGDVTPLMDERREFGFPPFTRIVDIRFNDTFPDRIVRMKDRMVSSPSSLRRILPENAVIMPFVDGIRIILRRDRGLVAAKQALRSFVESFEQSEKYPGHIYFDVDPQ